MRHWYVVQTGAKAEHTAANNLKRQGFGVYLPTYARRRRHARKIEVVRAPLFPGYLFVALDLTAERWRPVLSTLGVRRLVSCGAELSVIPNTVIDEIRRREDQDGLVWLGPSPSIFTAGDAVSIEAGQAGELSALFVEMNDQHRAVVLLNILGRWTQVTISADRLLS